MPLVEDATMEVFLLDAREVRQRLDRDVGDSHSHEVEGRGVMRLRKKEEFSVVRYDSD